MFPQSGKSWRDYNSLNQNWSHQPTLAGNIPQEPAYGVNVSQLVCYAKACCEYQDVVDRGKLHTSKLLSQGYCRVNPVSTIIKIYTGNHDLVDPYNLAISKLSSDLMASVEA